MERLTDHFINPLYKLIFEKYPPCMSREVMDVIVNIVDWYASPGGTFIRVFGREKPLPILPRYSIDKQVMQEVPYHLATGLSARLHRKKRSSWHPLPFLVRLYKIKILKDVDAKAKDIMKLKFETKEFNLCDPHGKDHCLRV